MALSMVAYVRRTLEMTWTGALGSEFKTGNDLGGQAKAAFLDSRDFSASCVSVTTVTGNVLLEVGGRVLASEKHRLDIQTAIFFIT